MQTNEIEQFPMKDPPEIAIEWKDVEIQIKVLRTDVPSEENHFLRFVYTTNDCLYQEIISASILTQIHCS